MTHTETLSTAAWTPVTEDLPGRGKKISSRRLRHGITSVAEFARRAGIDRQTVTRAEAGKAQVGTVERLEQWLDDLDAEKGIDTASVAQADEAQPEMVEFDITGPKTDWHVVVRGPADIADDLRRQVVELLRDIEAGS